MAQQIQKYLIGDDVTKVPVDGKFPNRLGYWVMWEDVAPYIKEENFNSLQLLKAEIAKVAKVFEDQHSSYREMRDALDKLWQLSAV